MKKLIFTFLFLLFSSATGLAQAKDVIIQNLQSWRADIAAEINMDEHEKDLRISFLNRLIFQTERNYQGDQYRNFMIQTLKAFNRIPQAADNELYFNENLLLSIQEVLEPTEDLILFMRAFMEYSGLSEPSSAEDFGSHRSYINGDQIAQAMPLEAEQASDFLELKEKIDEEKLEKIPFRLSDEVYNLQYQDLQELMPKDLILENSFTP